MSLNDKMTALADAIRAKTGGTSTMTLDQMAQAVSGIAVGSGGVNTSDATATADQLLKGAIAYGVNGERITGTLRYYPKDGTTGISAVADSIVAVPIESTNKTHVRLDYDIVNPAAFLEESGISLKATLESFGDAAASDVVSGKTFTSAAGLKMTGTVQENTLAGINVLSGTELSSNETSVLIKYNFVKDTLCRDGSGYIFHIGLSDFGDATAADVAAGKTFTSAAGLKVTGTATSGSSGGIQAQHITSASDTITISGTGTVKVWGYGFYSSGSYSKTTYAFVGDGYYTASSYNTPTKTDAAFSINEDGTLSGLPSNITDLDLLVTIGI